MGSSKLIPLTGPLFVLPDFKQLRLRVGERAVLESDRSDGHKDLTARSDEILDFAAAARQALEEFEAGTLCVSNGPDGVELTKVYSEEAGDLTLRLERRVWVTDEVPKFQVAVRLVTRYGITQRQIAVRGSCKGKHQIEVSLSQTESHGSLLLNGEVVSAT